MPERHMEIEFLWPERAYVRTDRVNENRSGPGFSGNIGGFKKSLEVYKKSHMGVPIGNSVPGLRPGPALPTIIIPHPGALVKCFLNRK